MNVICDIPAGTVSKYLSGEGLESSNKLQLQIESQARFQQKDTLFFTLRDTEHNFSSGLNVKFSKRRPEAHLRRCTLLYDQESARG